MPRSRNAATVVVTAAIAVHLLYCLPIAAQRGYPAMLPWVNAVPPFLGFLGSFLIPVFDDSNGTRRMLRWVLSLGLALGLAAVACNAGSAVPAHFPEPMQIAVVFPFVLILTVPVVFALEWIACRLWRTVRTFDAGGAGSRAARFVLVAAYLIAVALSIGSILLPVALRTSLQGTIPRHWFWQSYCNRNLSAIGKGIFTYAMDADGKPPPDLQTLAVARNLDPRMFICPSSGHRHGDIRALNEWTDYVLVRNASPDMDGVTDAVLAHCKTEHHGNAGCNVLFTDASVCWYNARDFEELMRKQKSGESRRPSVPDPGGAVDTPSDKRDK